MGIHEIMNWRLVAIPVTLVPILAIAVQFDIGIDDIFAVGLWPFLGASFIMAQAIGITRHKICLYWQENHLAIIMAREVHRCRICADLVTRIKEHYTKSGSFAAVLNLDPGVEDTPYAPDVDIRDHIDIVALMRQHKLGPNGALMMASDIMASKLDIIQNEADTINPDYLIVDTPGQIELFAYRSSGPYITENFVAEDKVGIFMYDGKLITDPTNFVSISMLATSIRLRLGLPMINLLSKQDLITDMVGEIIKWSSNLSALENAIASSTDGESYALISNILRGLNQGGFSQGLIPISSVTGEGMVNLEMALSRIINQGEEIED